MKSKEESQNAWIFPTYTTHSPGSTASNFQKQVLWARGIRSSEQLEDFFDISVSDATLFKDFERIITRIKAAISRKEKILIYGDYDVDGITSCALLYQFFKVQEHFGGQAVAVEVAFPKRGIDGYGIRPETIERARQDCIKLLITIDNGITAHQAIAEAQSHKIDSIIIDHHKVSDSLPKAYGILNPRQADCRYPYKEFASVGLVYKIVHRLSEDLLSKESARLFQERYKDLVAIGTYQDLAYIPGENRRYIREGLKVLQSLWQSKRTNLRGLLEILEQSGQSHLDYNTIGFTLGPILNSAGRIGDAQTAFALLTSQNRRDAKELATQLIRLNTQRRAMIEEAYQEAQEQIASNSPEPANIIILKSHKWHEGIIGLIAQRLSQAQQRSTIIMSACHHRHYTGSARAYGDLDIGKTITELKEYLLECGGHKSAAGFSVRFEQTERFIAALQEKIPRAQPQRRIEIDAIVDTHEINDRLYKDLEELAPFGEGNPAPVILLKDLRIQNIKLSKRGLDSLFQLSTGRQDIHIVAFNKTAYTRNFQSGDHIDIICKATTSQERINFELLDAKHTKNN